MQNDLEQILLYFCEKYPHKRELSKARLTKMVYLADWSNTLRHGSQITEIVWELNHFGPYVEDVSDVATESPCFTIERSENMYGNSKDVIYVNEKAYNPDLSLEVKETLDFIIDNTKNLHWNGFIQLVYSTYPVVSQPRYSQLNLVSLAKEYQK